MSGAPKRKTSKAPKARPSRPFRITFEVSREGHVDLPPSLMKTLSAEEIAQWGSEAGIDAVLAGFEAKLALTREKTGRVDLKIIVAALRFAAHRLKAPWLADHLLSVLMKLAEPVLVTPDFIRWGLVSHARNREGLAWLDAYDRAAEESGWSEEASASEKAKWSYVAGSPATMKAAYERVSRERRTLPLQVRYADGKPPPRRRRRRTVVG